MLYARTGAFSGIGFAIPSNQAKFVYQSLKKNGRVTRGWLGVSIADVSANLPEAKSFGYKGNHGVLVEESLANTPATGKLQPGDIITAMDGKPVESVQELRNHVASTAPNTDVKFTIFRDNKEQPVTVKLGEQPENVLASSAAPGESGGAAEAEGAKIGLRLATPNQELLKKWDLTEVKGGPPRLSGTRIATLAPRSRVTHLRRWRSGLRTAPTRRWWSGTSTASAERWLTV